MHLTGEADSKRRVAELCDHPAKYSLARDPPVLRVLLGPPWPRGRQRVAFRRRRDHLAELVDGDRSRSAGADIESDQCADLRGSLPFI